MWTRRAVLGAPLAAFAQDTFKPNYDESLVPAYTLPDPLRDAAGKPVTRAKWPARRAELLKQFSEEMFGRTPGPPPPVRTEILTANPAALNGRALREEVRLFLSDKPNGPKIDLLLYRPVGSPRPMPVFFCLSFRGNKAVEEDASLKSSEASRFPIADLVGRGYAIATAHYGDLAPDNKDHFLEQALSLYPRDPNDGSAWAAIGAWAWGMSRALDYLLTRRDLDARRTAVVGHSRIGKAAIWAGAQDERFAMVISNDSGCGGAALSRRIFGETVGRINRSFPHWWAPNFRKYSENEKDLPFDQHELLACIAPRPLYVASATEDLWADPKGEFLGALHADPVYRLLGTEGLPVKQMPPPDTPVMGRIAYHVRTGKHDITAWDWQRYMDFADKQWGKPPQPKA